MARNGRETGKASFLQEVGREDEVTCAYVLLWEALPSGGYLASCSLPKPVFIETLRASIFYYKLHNMCIFPRKSHTYIPTLMLHDHYTTHKIEVQNR